MYSPSPAPCRITSYADNVLRVFWVAEEREEVRHMHGRLVPHAVRMKISALVGIVFLLRGLVNEEIFVEKLPSSLLSSQQFRQYFRGVG